MQIGLGDKTNRWDASQPICLPEQSDQNVSGGTRVEVCGWGGHQSGGREGRSDQLHRANIQVVDEETCRQEYSFNSFHRRNFEELKDTTLCAGGREGKKVSDTCMVRAKLHKIDDSGVLMLTRCSMSGHMHSFILFAFL